MNSQSTTPEQSNRLLAALAYPIWIIALVIILTDMKKDAFMRRHGWTALFWGIAWVVIYVALASSPTSHSWDGSAPCCSVRSSGSPG